MSTAWMKADDIKSKHPLPKAIIRKKYAYLFSRPRLIHARFVSSALTETGKVQSTSITHYQVEFLF